MNKKNEKTMSISQKVAEFQAQKKKKKTSFLHDIKEELRKVSWTSREEIKICTKIVLGVVFVLGMGIYVVDLTLKGALHGITRITHFIVQ